MNFEEYELEWNGTYIKLFLTKHSFTQKDNLVRVHVICIYCY